MSVLNNCFLKSKGRRSQGRVKRSDRLLNWHVCSSGDDVSLLVPTGYSARHVRRQVGQQFLLHLMVRLFLLVLVLVLTLLLLFLREAALFIQPKVVISRKALQESTDCLALGLHTDKDLTSAGGKQVMALHLQSIHNTHNTPQLQEVLRRHSHQIRYCFKVD